jgi:hypothetical protein
MKKIMLKLLIGSLCVNAVIGIIILLLGDFGEIQSKILITASTVFGFSILGCSTIHDKKEYRDFSTVGMVTSLIACFFSNIDYMGCCRDI